jgi:hypothetical protein
MDKKVYFYKKLIWFNLIFINLFIINLYLGRSILSKQNKLIIFFREEYFYITIKRYIINIIIIIIDIIGCKYLLYMKSDNI